jgi:hypothetical protein
MPRRAIATRVAERGLRAVFGTVRIRSIERIDHRGSDSGVRDDARRVGERASAME